MTITHCLVEKILVTLTASLGAEQQSARIFFSAKTRHFKRRRFLLYNVSILSINNKHSYLWSYICSLRGQDSSVGKKPD